MPKGRQRLAADVRRSIEEPERIGKLWEAMERGRANRAATIEQAGLDLPAFRDRVRSIKETAAQDPSIAEAFADAVRANGGRVLFAARNKGRSFARTADRMLEGSEAIGSPYSSVSIFAIRSDVMWIAGNTRWDGFSPAT